jgi:hypothetical protein
VADIRNGPCTLVSRLISWRPRETPGPSVGSGSVLQLTTLARIVSANGENTA